MAGCQAGPAASVSFLPGLAGHTGPLPFISLCEDLQLQLFAVLPPHLGENASSLGFPPGPVEGRNLCCRKKVTFLLLGRGKAQAADGLSRVGGEEHRGTQNKESQFACRWAWETATLKTVPDTLLRFLCLEMGSGKEMSPEGHSGAVPFCCDAVIQKKKGIQKKAEFKWRLKTGLLACVACRTGLVPCCPFGPWRALGSPQGKQKRIVTNSHKPLPNTKDNFPPAFRPGSCQMLRM